MKLKDENGEVVVEASLVVTLVVIFISVMFYIGMILYQQSLVSIMANKTASDIAQVYSNNLKDPFTGYVDPDSVYQSVTYSNMKTDAYMDLITQKANTLAFYRLKSARILTTGETSVDVQIVQKPNDLLKSQVVVTVHDKYELPLVSFFGVNNILTFSAIGRADCVDILEYLNGVEAVGDPENSSIAYLPNSDTCLVQFYDNKIDRNWIATIPVLRGKSILTSNYYTHSIMPINPTHSKFDFTGWVKEDGSGFFATTEIDGNTVVYGTWECTISFDADGGSVTPESKKVPAWSVTEFPTPTRAGYSFLGWFTQKDGAGVQYYSNISVVDDNITLYASWRCNHNYILDSHVAGNCVTRELKRYKCVQCGATYEDEGEFGGHSFGASVCIRTATCQQRSLWRKTCVNCGVNQDTEGSFGDHVDGRCGKTHDLGSGFFMPTHNTSNGYTRTVKGECIVCGNCGEFWYPGVWRNGQWVTSGMICRAHNDNSGTNRPDSSFVWLQNAHLHG